jgi:hypothetical protein
MTPEQKLQIQALVMEHLQASVKEQPTMLADVLLSGDGFQFLSRLIQTHEFAARQRAQIFNDLLQAIRGVAPPNVYQQPPPAWRPNPANTSTPIPPVYQAPEE